MKILIIDNYDSFVHNLYHAVRSITNDTIDIKKNDAVSPEEAASFDKILLSPGPGIPSEAGNLLAIIRFCANKTSILGVCLGHQAIAEAMGGSLINIEAPFHGIQSLIACDPSDPLFAGIGNNMQVGRYHSWIVNPQTLPDCLRITALSEEKHIMAFKHSDYSLYGVQFHPESILTTQGNLLLKNWLDLP
ncbi:MAG: anthranilate synthase component II [Bacteroidales bacterium]